jgi:hypothetical protein
MTGDPTLSDLPRERTGLWQWSRRLVACTFLTVACFVLAPAVSASAYCGTCAASYADRWWNSTNTSYWRMNDDCTNFVSQALHDGAGGKYPFRGGSSTVDDHNWWMNLASPSWTQSWTFAAHLRLFLINDWPGGVPEGSTPKGDLSAQMASYTPTNMVTGDVLFYNFGGGIDHTTIQVGIDYGTWIATYANQARVTGYHNVVDQHSNSRHHVHWSLIDNNDYWRTTTIYFMHISSGN